jgi:hypothetical protein
VSADSIVPGAGKPQALNRYGYVFNNPLKYADPTGHCGKADGKDEEEEECQKAIGDIEKNYKNIKVNARRWTIKELQLVLKALADHPFLDDIKSARQINLLRSDIDPTARPNQLIAGDTTHSRDNLLDFKVTIYDDAWRADVDGNGVSIFGWEENFLGTAIHEFTHVAVARNPTIFASFKKAQETRSFDALSVPIGQAYSWSIYPKCDEDCVRNEFIAMAVAAYQLRPRQFEPGTDYQSYFNIGRNWIANWMDTWKQGSHNP